MKNKSKINGVGSLNHNERRKHILHLYVLYICMSCHTIIITTYSTENIHVQNSKYMIGKIKNSVQNQLNWIKEKKVRTNIGKLHILRTVGEKLLAIYLAVSIVQYGPSTDQR